jgi:hypothetical protein
MRNLFLGEKIMDTQAAVTEIKSLKRMFNHMQKTDTNSPNFDYADYSSKLDTAVDAISSNNIGAAKSVLTGLKAAFDENADVMKGAERLVLDGAPFDQARQPLYKAKLLEEKRSERYSSKVNSVIAKLS